MGAWAEQLVEKTASGIKKKIKGMGGEWAKYEERKWEKGYNEKWKKEKKLSWEEARCKKRQKWI